MELIFVVYLHIANQMAGTANNVVCLPKDMGKRG